MIPSKSRFALFALNCFMLIIALSTSIYGQQLFENGQTIEYKVMGSYPEKWEIGVVIRPIEGGKQFLIREKPTQFFPEGSEKAYYIENLRSLTQNQAKNETEKPTTTPSKTEIKQLFPTLKPKNTLLTEEEILSYARLIFGGDNQQINQAHPQREQLTNLIRDYIKEYGTDFKAPIPGTFDTKLNEQGTKSVHIIQAVNDNYGAPPKLTDYFGTFYLRTANRGSNSVKNSSSGKKVIEVTDEQHESGRITINKDGSYEWELLKGDQPDKWIKGKWRIAKSTEMLPTEGGIALWLDHTNLGEEYMVRLDREEGFTGWISLGVGAGRRPVQYGRPKTP